MFKIMIDYPDKQQEIEIMNRFTEGVSVKPEAVISGEQIVEMQNFNQSIYADRKIKEYVADIVDATRRPQKYSVDLSGYIEYGASPRASLWLILGGKAHAMANGRGYVKPEDIKAVAFDVLRHRIILTYEAEAEEITTDQIIKKILEKIRVP
jgi:MoxR-like ATPase